MFRLLDLNSYRDGICSGRRLAQERGRSRRVAPFKAKSRLPFATEADSDSHDVIDDVNQRQPRKFAAGLNS